MKKRKILWIVIFNIIIVLSEIIFGLISNSYALISDALHNFGDVLALIITMLTIDKSRDIQMRATLFNSIFLYMALFYIIYEAIDKLIYPQEIEPLYMIIVGLIALIANGISAYLLSKMRVSNCPNHSHDHQELNINLAYLHMLSDALISFGVIVGGIIIYYFKIYYIDATLSIIFSIYILIHSYPLLKKSYIYFK
jgi:cobalt-zinc-cadmium efflux system protein